MKKLPLSSMILLWSILFSAAFGGQDWLFPEEQSGCQGKSPGTANPAAVYCQDMGYEYKIVNSPEGQRGVCMFPDGTSCDAWDFLKGKSHPECSYCAKNGYDIKTLDDGKNPLSKEYAVCVDKQNRVVGSVVKMAQVMERAVQGAISKPVWEIAQPQVWAPPSAYAGPETFDWRDYRGQNWITSVKNQGGCGSCWAFSAIGVSEAIINIYQDDPSIDHDLSEQYLVSDCVYNPPYMNCCGGWSDLSLEYIIGNGIPDEGCMPYVDGSGCSCSNNCANCTYSSEGMCSNASCSDKCADWSSRLTFMGSYGAVVPWDVETIKQYLREKGPLSVYVGIGSSYGGYFDGDIYRCGDDQGINHAVVIVGYNDTEGYWIIKNSWGASWNSNGYYKLGYGECDVERYVYYAGDVSMVDTDGDNVCDVLDNCPNTANANQQDTDGDGFGDACDNCPNFANVSQTNSDGDSYGDACDNCVSVDNEDQQNSDTDGYGDACDNCALVDNEDQQNSDGDSYGDACDNCALVANEDQQNSDTDSYGDACDNCTPVENEDQQNSDGDEFGDACDNCPETDNPDQADTDEDTVGDECDNCPSIPNQDQANSDADESGDLCDNCPEADNPGQADSDEDTVGDECDNCPDMPNPGQEDADGDDIGDVCDYVCGSFDEDDLINILDIVFLINHIYKNGPVPEPLVSADVDSSEEINILDIVYLINFIYKNGPEPNCL